MPERSDHPSAFPWPPVLVLAAVVSAWGLQETLALPRLPVMVKPLGVMLVVAALAVDLWVLLLFRRARTAIRPDRGASALVTSGPFTRSRNPIYVANIVLLVGLMLMTGNLWYGPMALITFVAIDRLAAAPEEAHLARQFGSAFETYRQKVRRWL